MTITIVFQGNGNTLGIHGPMEPMNEADIVENRLKEKHEEIYLDLLKNL